MEEPVRLAQEADVSRRFQSHVPTGTMLERMEIVRGLGIEMAATLQGVTAGSSRYLSLALTAVEEAVMWANKAITLGAAEID